MTALRNHVRLCEMLGQDAVERSFALGGKVVNLRVATVERWTDKATGEPREATDWHNVAVFSDRDVEKVRLLRKGEWVEVDGSLKNRKYLKDGRDQWITEVVVRGPDHRVLVLPKRQPRDQAPASPQASADPPAEIDDDVPF